MRLRDVRLSVLILSLCVLVLSQPVQAVGVLAVSSTTTPGGFTRYTLAWTSSSGGAVSANAFQIRAGVIWQVKFVPSSAAAPTDEYDVTLVDEDGVDLLGGEGADLSTSAASFAVPLSDAARVYHDGTQRLDLVVAAAGDTTKGTVIVWVR